MKRFLTLLTAVLLTVTILPCAAFAVECSLANFRTDAEPVSFADVSPEDWFAPYVRIVSKSGLMIGDGEDRFAPEGNVTLAEVCAIAARIHAIYYTGSAQAADEYEHDADKPWFHGYVQYCTDNGIMIREPGDVTKAALRIECATLLSRALSEEELMQINTVADSAIPDLPSMPESEGVYLLYRAGVLTGTDETGAFEPESKVRRCEAAAVVARMIVPALRRSFTSLVYTPEERQMIQSIEEADRLLQESLIRDSLAQEAERQMIQSFYEANRK